MKTIAIIMAGGSGERFWPLSRSAYPKQLLKLKDDQNMLGMSIRRIQPLVAPSDVYVLTTEKLVEAIRHEIPGLASANIIAEPEGKNTAACLTLASAYIAEKYGEDVVMIVLTADHYIRDESAFIQDCRAAADFAAGNDTIITFGIRPTRPETGYGYVEAGDSASNLYPIFKVNSFREKPDLATARKFMEDGDFFWNSGMFVWKNSVFQSELSIHMPAMFSAVEEMRAAYRQKADTSALLTKIYQRLEKISIDVGLMERTEKVHMLRASYDWDDIGSWSSLYRILPQDAVGNASIGNALFIQSQNSIAYSAGDNDEAPPRRPLVVGYNLEGIVIVQTPDATLVLPAEDVQKVKDIVAYLKAHDGAEYL